MSAAKRMVVPKPLPKCSSEIANVVRTTGACSRSTAMSGKHTRGDGDGRANDKCEKRELKSGGVALENDAAHGRLEFERLSQVAAHELPEIVPVLRVKRQIQPERMTQLRDLPRRCAFPEHLLDGITRHDVNHQEDQRKHEPERRECQQESFEEVASHV